LIKVGIAKKITKNKVYLKQLRGKMHKLDNPPEVMWKTSSRQKSRREWIW
jgi:hypothetical protein